MGREQTPSEADLDERSVARLDRPTQSIGVVVPTAHHDAVELEGDPASVVDLDHAHEACHVVRVGLPTAEPMLHVVGVVSGTMRPATDWCTRRVDRLVTRLVARLVLVRGVSGVRGVVVSHVVVSQVVVSQVVVV